MNNELKKYHGVVVPMVTPVKENGTLDTQAVERIIAFFATGRCFPTADGNDW